MASAKLSKDQFLCSICLDIFTDPVTLPCGHNFCKMCITQYWSREALCKCPYCEKLFSSRPEINVNIFVAEIVANFRQSQNNPSRSSIKPGDVLCDICTQPKHKAVQSCLVCLSSYCESHLEPHLNKQGLKRHQLIEPHENLEDRVCSIHNKPLELFCSHERLCICVLCVFSDHKDHEVIPMKEASEQHKRHLQETEEQVEEDISKRVKKINELRHSLKVNQVVADKEISDGVKVFTALKQSVEKSLNLFISEMNKKKSHTEQQTESLICEIEQEVCELEKTRAELKQRSQSEDPLQLLQTSTLPDPKTETRDWTNVTVCAPTYGGALARALSQLEQEFNEKTKSVYLQELKRVQTKEINIILDENTAHPQLFINDNQVCCKNEPRRLPFSPERFDSLFVLGKQHLPECSFFEAEVKGKTEWTLGVAEESVKRKGPHTLNSQNGFWTLGLRNGAYYVSDKPKISVFTKCKPEIIGVFIDYNEGIISYFDVKAPALLYSFAGTTFTKKLYPICSPGSYSMTNSNPIKFIKNTKCRIQ